MALMHRRGVALKMFMDEEEVRELGIAHHHQRKPRHRHRREHREPMADMHARPERPVPAPERVDDQHQAWQHQAHQPLGEHGNPHGRPHRKQPAAARSGARLRVLSDQETAQRHSERRRHADIKRVEVRAEIPERHGDQHPAGRHSHRAPPPARSRRHHDRDREQSAHRPPESRLPGTDAKHLKGKRTHPEMERRFFEVLEAVVADRDPVAGGCHFAGDLSIATLIGGHEFAQVERSQPEREHEKDCQCREQTDARLGANALGRHAPGRCIGAKRTHRPPATQSVSNT